MKLWKTFFHQHFSNKNVCGQWLFLLQIKTVFSSIFWKWNLKNAVFLSLTTFLALHNFDQTPFQNQKDLGSQTLFYTSFSSQTHLRTSDRPMISSTLLFLVIEKQVIVIFCMQETSAAGFCKAFFERWHDFLPLLWVNDLFGSTFRSMNILQYFFVSDLLETKFGRRPFYKLIR